MTPRPGEAAWTDDDVSYALAWEQYQHELDADRCSGCGQPRSESTDPTNERPARSQYRIEEHVCFACRTKELALEGYRVNKEEPPKGLYLAVVKK